MAADQLSTCNRLSLWLASAGWFDPFKMAGVVGLAGAGVDRGPQRRRGRAGLRAGEWVPPVLYTSYESTKKVEGRGKRVGINQRCRCWGLIVRYDEGVQVGVIQASLASIRAV